MNDPKLRTEYREGEKPRAHFRAPDRCFQMNGWWYFATREGINVGPYGTRDTAREAAAKLIGLLHGVRDATMIRRMIEAFVPLGEPW